MIDTDLNIPLKYVRWSIDEEGNQVLIESMEVLKSKVE